MKTLFTNIVHNGLHHDNLFTLICKYDDPMTTFRKRTLMKGVGKIQERYNNSIKSLKGIFGIFLWTLKMSLGTF